MKLNANFDETAIVHAGREKWVASPIRGVDRRMLDRIGDEVARATTIVRYAPGSHFSGHTHTGGEEFFVLDGVFQDEHGDFPAGTYVRNPPTSSHTPGSKPGCTIFVKLWQFDLQDRHQMRIDTNTAEWSKGQSGVETLDLYTDAREHVRMERWAPGTSVSLDPPHGLEILVTAGSFSAIGEEFEVQSWIRVPVGGSVELTAGANGATVWTKRDHLQETPKPPSV